MTWPSCQLFATRYILYSYSTSRESSLSLERVYWYNRKGTPVLYYSDIRAQRVYVCVGYDVRILGVYRLQDGSLSTGLVSCWGWRVGEQKNEQADVSSPHSLKSISCKASERLLHPRTCICRRHRVCLVSTSTRAVSRTLRNDLSVSVQ